jgi:hypothetical protein
MSCICKCFGGSKSPTRHHKSSVEERQILSSSGKLLGFNPLDVAKVDLVTTSPFRNNGTRPQQKNSMISMKLDEKIKEKRNTGGPIINRMKSKQRYSSFGITGNKRKEDIDAFVDKMTGKLRSQKKEMEKKHWDFKDKFTCFFCWGEKCKHEIHTNNKNKNAIEGLHSDFITEDIIASQRPSKTLIEKYNLLQRFKDMNIGLIVNLQREGEHPSCGPNKLQESGYSYDPHIFAADDIKCRLSGWKDMSVPESVNFMLEIVKDMSMTIREERRKAIILLNIIHYRQ